MTPTLIGRWQIRFFLLGTVGLLIALVVGTLVKNIALPLVVLLYVFVQGVILDIPYQYIITFRWDRDWPTSFQIGAGIIEGTLLWGLIQTGQLPGVSPQMLPFSIYLAQYAITWFCIFMLSQGVLRILWPDWHYRGGQWLTRRSQRYEASSQASGFQQQLKVQLPFQPSAAPPQSSSQAAVLRQSEPQPIVRPLTPIPPVLRQSGSQSAAPRQSDSQPAVSRQSGPQPVVLRQSGSQPIVQPLTPIPPAPRPFKCACGYTDDQLHGQFCPNCGRPTV